MATPMRNSVVAVSVVVGVVVSVVVVVVVVLVLQESKTKSSKIKVLRRLKRKRMRQGALQRKSHPSIQTRIQRQIWTRAPGRTEVPRLLNRRV